MIKFHIAFEYKSSKPKAPTAAFLKYIMMNAFVLKRPDYKIKQKHEKSFLKFFFFTIFSLL